MVFPDFSMGIYIAKFEKERIKKLSLIIKNEEQQNYPTFQY